MDSDEVLSEMTETSDIPSDGFSLGPKQFILGWTAERIKLPVQSRLAARVEGRSSLGRFGLSVHLTAPTIHAGFEGRIRLEIVNHNIFPIRLREDMRICQLIFELTYGTPESGYKGQYFDQEPNPS